MDLDTVCSAVADAFAETGAATPDWPDPHPDRQPAEDEYSRCLDPAKYQIVGARAEAWLRALTGLGLATVARVEDLGAARRDDPPRGAPMMTRARWVRPHRPSAIPLLVCFRSFEGVPDNVVSLGAGEPAVEIASAPDCGCDACDSGSTDLLEELDDHVLDVISGAFVHVRTRHGVAQGRRNGWSASGFGERGLVEQVLSDARAGRSRHPVLRGACWWKAAAGGQFR